MLFIGFFSVVAPGALAVLVAVGIFFGVDTEAVLAGFLSVVAVGSALAGVFAGVTVEAEAVFLGVDEDAVLAVLAALFIAGILVVEETVDIAL